MQPFLHSQERFVIKRINIYIYIRYNPDRNQIQNQKDRNKKNNQNEKNLPNIQTQKNISHFYYWKRRISYHHYPCDNGDFNWRAPPNRHVQNPKRSIKLQISCFKTYCVNSPSSHSLWIKFQRFYENMTFSDDHQL